MTNYKLYNNYKIFFETPNDGYSYFFGYYDKTPLNKNNDKLLTHRVSFDGREVRDGDIAEVGYFDLSTKKFIKIDDTLAWNWQQGSQLQWMPPNYDDEIIYNNIQNNKFISIRYNTKTQKTKIIPFPIYVIHPNGKEALAINYERHYWCRPGYNYQNIKNKKWDQRYHEQDGIYKINLVTGAIKLIISISDIIKNKPLQEFNNNNNWLEHLMYNPSGNRFMFFHRWNLNKNDYTRLYTANAYDGKDLFMFPDTRFYSHADWKSENELTIWSKEPELYEYSKKTKNIIKGIKRSTFLKFIIKPLYNILKPALSENILKKVSNQSKLLNYRDKTHSYKIIGDHILKGNGHITWMKNNNKILNDTYEDENNFRHLMLFDVNRNKIIKIGNFFSNYNSCIYRADLHPRFSLDEKHIIIDSAHNIKRKVIVLTSNNSKHLAY